MGKNSQPTVEIPKFTPPPKVDFNTPFGSVNFADNAYSFNESEQAALDRAEVQALQKSILKSIGVTTANREASLQEFEDTFFKESSRIALPSLENSLFDRGLGGSKFYGDQITDLISKLATEAILQRENLQVSDENQKLSQLAGVSNVANADTGAILNLLGLASNHNTQQQQLAQQQYQTTLPFKSKVNVPNKNPIGSLIGLGIGGLAGLPYGNPLLGAKAGANIGGIFDK